MSDRIIRLASAVALLGSGTLAFAAAWQRWAGPCPWRDFETPACYRAQDHAQDYLLPGAGWIPVGDAAQLQGLALGALALATLAVPAVALRRYDARSVVLGIVLAVPLVLVGLATWLSGRAATPVGIPGDRLAFAAWSLLMPAVLLVLAIVVHQTQRRAGRRRDVAALVLLAWSTPLAQFVWAPGFIMYGSHDTSPWFEAVGGVMVALAGLLLATVAVHRVAALRRTPAPPTEGSGAEVAATATT